MVKKINSKIIITLSIAAPIAAYILGIILGYYFPDYGLLAPLVNRLSEINQLANPQKVLFIATNNITTSILILLGSLAILPGLFILSINGYILGVITNLLLTKEILSLRDITLSIAPHGILEIPALLYSSYIGITSTIYLLEKRDSKRNILFRILSRYSIVVLLLLAASIVEVYITPLLLPPPE